jgi:hypothetical protein
VNAPSNKCVGLANMGSTSNGTALILWDCHLHPDQQWQTIELPSVFGLRWRDW